MHDFTVLMGILEAEIRKVQNEEADKEQCVRLECVAC